LITTTDENRSIAAMENIWNNFRTTVSAWSSSHQRRSNIDDTTKEHERTTDLQELKRITKRDSKKERRLKFRQCFERNNVIMVRINERTRYIGFFATLFLNWQFGSLLHSSLLPLLDGQTRWYIFRHGRWWRSIGRWRSTLLSREIKNPTGSAYDGTQLLCDMLRTVQTEWYCCLVDERTMRTYISSALHCEIFW
jgi:hypothetical protein